ncbi:MAG: hypothetical protein M0Z53_14245 [Thermaerobacter sp.]|nr:hypothetical protein [Thermaerobacter sp.]
MSRRWVTELELLNPPLAKKNERDKLGIGEIAGLQTGSGREVEGPVAPDPAFNCRLLQYGAKLHTRANCRVRAVR